MKPILIVLALFLSSCATYTYEKAVDPDGIITCKVTVTSMREVKSGAVSIGPNCETSGGAEGMDFKHLLQIMRSLIPAAPSQ